MSLSESQSVEELIKAALTQNDEEEREEIVHRLQRDQDSERVFSVSKELCASMEPQDRALGAEILGFLGFPGRPFIRESAEMLTQLLHNETDSDVLYYAIDALRHLEDFRTIGNVEIPERGPVPVEGYPNIIPQILPFANHPDADVRAAVVLALGAALSNVLKGEDKPAVEALIVLTCDEDRDVRDWATFELAAEPMVDAEWPEITEALWKRVRDEDPEIRSQALLGLARRRATGVLESLVDELSWQSTQEHIIDYTLEAAYELADYRLCPVLLRFKDRFDSEWVKKALEACNCG